MYPDAGPSRPAPYPPRPPPQIGLIASPRNGSMRWDDSDRDREREGYGRLGEGSTPRPYAIPPWQNRPARGGFRPHGPSGNGPRPRSLSPSPPRRGYDRDRDREREWERDRDRGLDGRDRPTVDAGRMADGPLPRRPGGGGFGSLPPRSSIPERESWRDRRNNERDRRDDRDRERFDMSMRNGGGRPGLPPQHLPPVRFGADRPRSPPPSAPRGGKGLLVKPAAPFRFAPGPRTPIHIPLRETSVPIRKASGDSLPSPLTIVTQQQQQNSQPSTPSVASTSGAPHSVRGSSSPDLKRARDERPLTPPTVAPSALKDEPEPEAAAEEPQDLEEGEVVSPVHTSRPAPWTYADERSRRPWSPSRDRDRERRDRERERDRDRGWERERDGRERRRQDSPSLGGWAGRRQDEGWGQRTRRRSTSNPSRGVGEWEGAAAVQSGAEGETGAEKKQEVVQDDAVEDGEVLPSDEVKAEEAEMAEVAERAEEAEKPSEPLPGQQQSSPASRSPPAEPQAVTPAPDPEPRTPPVVADVAAEQQAVSADVDMEDAEVDQEKVVVDELRLEVTDVKLASPVVTKDVALPATLPSQDVPPASPTPLVNNPTPVVDAPPSPVAPSPSTDATEVEPAVELMDVEMAKEDVTPKQSSPDLLPPQRQSIFTPLPPSSPHSTIAERRSVKLPAPTSPFTNKLIRKDPMPTAYSTDTETEGGPKTGEPEGLDTPMLEDEGGDGGDEEEDLYQSNLVAKVKLAQAKHVTFDESPIIAWNLATVPERSTRQLADDDGGRKVVLRHLSRQFEEEESAVVGHVGLVVAREQESMEAKLERLRSDYLELNEEWKGHCAYLDDLMKPRGRNPYDSEPVMTPGPVMPSTPSYEELLVARPMRRRGAGGDVVSTDADFEEILAKLADNAARDPTMRAHKTAAVVPDMIFGAERNLRYADENDLVLDPLAFYDFEGVGEPIWTTEERATFVKRYLAYPKQFGKIAEGIPNKTASNCVLYYYRTKKEMDYKSLLASKRGGGKRKLALTNKGKSSALLQDLDKVKPTVSEEAQASSPAARTESSVVPGTTAKKGRAPAGEGAPRRRKGGAAVAAAQAQAQANGLADDKEDGDGDTQGDSAGTSRAGSEAPSATSSKAKLRMTVKTAKRPRVSSIPELATPIRPAPVAAAFTPNAEPLPPSSEAATPTAVAASALAELADASAAQAALLPQTGRKQSRGGKRRKVLPADADPNAPPSSIPPTPSDLSNGTPSAPGATGTPAVPEKPTRRSATNSYWSVDEKRQLKELIVVHGQDAKLISSQLKGKSERQVLNFFEAHKTELEGLESAAAASAAAAAASGASADAGTGVKSEAEKNHHAAAQGEPYKPAQATRTIYDAFNFAPNNDRYEPRLGMFPSGPTANPPSQATTPPPQSAPRHEASSPIKAISRPGGMRISALLNDEPAVEPPRATSSAGVQDTTDAASDGTVDEGMEGVTRPSPRAPPPALAPQNYPPMRYDQRVDERYRSSPVTNVPPQRSSLPPSPYTTSPWSGPPPHADPSYPPRRPSAPPQSHGPSSWDSRPPSAPAHPHHHAGPYGSSSSRYESLPPMRRPEQHHLPHGYAERQYSHDREREWGERRFSVGGGGGAERGGVYGGALPPMKTMGNGHGHGHGPNGSHGHGLGHELVHGHGHGHGVMGQNVLQRGGDGSVDPGAGR
ncbi:hypothetical protein IAT38_004538 [Cryptococcus sp. DSM 104549]